MRKRANLARFLYTLSGITYAGAGVLFSYLIVPVWVSTGVSFAQLVSKAFVPVAGLFALSLFLAWLAYRIDPKEENHDR